MKVQECPCGMCEESRQRPAGQAYITRPYTNEEWLAHLGFLFGVDETCSMCGRPRRAHGVTVLFGEPALLCEAMPIDRTIAVPIAALTGKAVGIVRGWSDEPTFKVSDE